MGLLDTSAMKLLFGGAQYMKDREEARRAEAVQGLIGARPWTEQYQNAIPGSGQTLGSMFADQPTTSTVSYPGSGLLASNPTPQQFQVAAGPALLGQPGYQGIGGSMVNQAAANQQSMLNQQARIKAAMEQQQQQQDWSTNNMTLAQQANFGLAQTQANLQRYSQVNDDYRAIAKDHRVAAAPYSDALESYQRVNDMAEEVGGYDKMNPPQQMATIVAYAKMAKPGEQLTEGEFKQVLDQTGIPGLFSKYTNMLQGKGQLGETEMRDLLNAMRSMAKTSKRHLDKINDIYDPLAQRSGVPGSYRRPAYQTGDLQQIPGQRDPIQKTVPPGERPPESIWD